MFTILQLIFFFLFTLPFQHSVSFRDSHSCSRVSILVISSSWGGYHYRCYIQLLGLLFSWYWVSLILYWNLVQFYAQGLYHLARTPCCCPHGILQSRRIWVCTPCLHHCFLFQSPIQWDCVLTPVQCSRHFMLQHVIVTSCCFPGINEHYSGLHISLADIFILRFGPSDWSPSSLHFAIQDIHCYSTILYSMHMPNQCSHLCLIRVNTEGMAAMLRIWLFRILSCIKMLKFIICDRYVVSPGMHKLPRPHCCKVG